jgi:hypothetical protein
LNAASLGASVEATHFGTTSSMMARPVITDTDLQLPRRGNLEIRARHIPRLAL